MTKGFYWRKTLWCFSGAIIMAFIFFVSIAASIHYGFAHLLSLTEMAKEALLCCKTIFSWCLVSPDMFRTIMPWIGFGVVITGLFIAFFRAFRSIMVSKKFLCNIQSVAVGDFSLLMNLAIENKMEIIPFRDTLLKSAFAIGLFRPKIYVSTGLIERLTVEELRTVILHEIHHVLKRDPLRHFILSFIKDAFFFLPIGRYLTDSFYINKELAADENAVTVTGHPGALATALLKMVKIKKEPLPAGVSIFQKGKLVEKRIRELLEPGLAGRERYKFPGKTLIFTAVGMAVLLVAIALPIHAGTYRMEKCNHDYCLSKKRVCPSDKDDCKRSCEKMERR